MTQETEIILIEPSWKAYTEYLAAAFIMMFYFLIIALPVFVFIWYHKASRAYEIRPDKIIVQRRLLSKSSRVFPIAAIRDVYVTQGVLQKIFDVGNVRVLSSDKNMAPLQINGIPHPVQLRALLLSYRKSRS
jgi:membrane protein YdbS with pleckstrin-like domain